MNARIVATAALVALAALVFAPRTVHAQLRDGERPPHRAALVIRDGSALANSQLGSIDTERDYGVGFLVTGAVLMPTSFGLLIGAMTQMCIALTHSCTPSNPGLLSGLLVASGVAFLGGIVSAIVGAIVCIHSSVRRGEWRRKQSASVELTGGPGELGLGLAGTF